MRKGTTWGQCKHVGTGENTREVNISRNHGLLHHRNLQCIPYLQTEFETRTAFLRVKRGRTVLVPRSSCSCTDYTRNVALTEYDNSYGYKGKDPALNVFIANISQEELQAKPETTSALQCNLQNCQTTYLSERFR